MYLSGYSLPTCLRPAAKLLVLTWHVLSVITLNVNPKLFMVVTKVGALGQTALLFMK